MTKKKTEEKAYFITPICTMRFATLTETYKYKGKDTGKYSCTVMCSQEDPEFKKILNTLEKMIKAHWGSNIPPQFYRPYGNGNDKTEAWGDIMENTYWIKASHKAEFGPIAFIGRSKNKIPIENIGKEFYSGAKVRIKFGTFFYGEQTDSTVGIGLDVVAIQKCGEGEVISNALSGFDAIDDDIDSSDVDPFAGLDDTAF